MNLALPALVILLGLLPGIACFYGYFAGKFDKRTAGVSGVEQLALFVLFAIPIDAAALRILGSLGYHFDFNVASHLLMGTASDTAIHEEIVTFFRQSTGSSMISYAVVLLAGFFIGSLGRRAVWACRLDTRIPYLRVKHDWFYILQGRMPGYQRDVLSYADVMTRLPDKDGAQTRLFRGLVIDFEISASGALESITLRDAYRGSGRGDDFEWKEIPSTRLLIMGSTIHSINVTYFELGTAGQAFRKRLRKWLRSFLFEEP